MIREDLGQFYGAVEIVDKGIGEILAFLEDSPLFDNTLFIYTTDHGIAFPRAKCTLYDPGLKTSLIMSLPSSEYFSGGKVFNQMISNIDLLPIILDLIKAQILKSLEGKSFLKVLMGESDSFREFIFAEKTSEQSAALTLGKRLAVMDIPSPVPQSRIPFEYCPLETAPATFLP